MVVYVPRSQQSFYTTGFSCFRFQYNGLRHDPALQPLDSFDIAEGKHFSQDTSWAQAAERP